VKDSEDRLISLRRAKVAEMLAKGHNQADIAKACVTSEPTISRDVQYLREQAIATMDDYLNDLPLQHAKARTAVDMVLRMAFEVMDDKGSDQRLEAAKLVLNATEIRLGFLSDLTALDKSIKQAEAMKKQIADLKQKQAKPVYEVVTSESSASGKKGQVKRRVVKKGKDGAKIAPIV
jgi:uncharacterized protein YerC